MALLMQFLSERLCTRESFNKLELLSNATKMALAQVEAKPEAVKQKAHS
ncbi:hypothetical protein QZM22_27215 [Burkholderia oklahomensis]|nr:hypothetical protein [Burkholderia oklahomensis]MDN7676084.1 hypothetical protein [Burkholderia oklahomensis]